MQHRRPQPRPTESESAFQQDSQAMPIQVSEAPIAHEPFIEQACLSRIFKVATWPLRSV